jgi:hypothetical protein
VGVVLAPMTFRERVQQEGDPWTMSLHHASWRTPEQQGREDDEGKGKELLLMQRVISISLG